MVTISNHIPLLSMSRSALGVNEQPPVTRGVAMNDVELPMTCGAYFSSPWLVTAEVRGIGLLEVPTVYTYPCF